VKRKKKSNAVYSVRMSYPSIFCEPFVTSLVLMCEAKFDARSGYDEDVVRLFSCDRDGFREVTLDLLCEEKWMPAGD